MRKLLSIVLALMLICGAAFADESRLSVSGSGTVYMEADQATATLGVSLNGEDLAGLQNQANETIEKICEALVAAGLDEKNISTSHIYISPDYDSSSWRGSGDTIKGYIVNHALSIHTPDTDRIGMYIDAAFAAGANTFDSVGFSVQDDSEARDQALELAVQEAFRKAEVIATASGKSLEGIVEINEGNLNTAYNNSGSAYYKVWDTEAAAAGMDTTVRAAQVRVSANVQIVFEMK